ncbi:MAG: hypothetical protein ACK4RG_07700, partial [Fimbriimonadales bacterium]
MSLAMLLEWWNFIFALPLAVGGLLLLGLAMSGLIDLSDSDGEAEASDAEAADDADTAESDSAETSEEVGKHALVKTPYSSHDHHADTEKPLWLKLLNLFGIGMGLPLSMAVPLLLMIWGAAGLISNGIFAPLLKDPALYAPL